jgi:very-short-patch-repair endonuclease
MSDPRNETAKELRENSTKAESLLWELLRGKQLCGLKFRRQHPVDPYFADFACVSKQLIVELDGGYHDQTCDKDLKRQRILEAQGWQLIRFSNEDVLESVESVARAIATHLGLEYELVRRPRDGSGIMSSKNPTRSPTREARVPVATFPMGRLGYSLATTATTCVDTNALGRVATGTRASRVGERRGDGAASKGPTHFVGARGRITSDPPS